VVGNIETFLTCRLYARSDSFTFRTSFHAFPGNESEWICSHCGKTPILFIDIRCVDHLFLRWEIDN
jgi:hypothetical protein